MLLEKKSENSGGFRVFDFGLYQNRKLGNVGKCFFKQILTVIVT